MIRIMNTAALVCGDKSYVWSHGVGEDSSSILDAIMRFVNCAICVDLCNRRKALCANVVELHNRIGVPLFEQVIVEMRKRRNTL